MDEWLLTSDAASLPDEVRAHLRSCASCRQVFAAMTNPLNTPEISPSISENIRATIRSETKAVRPLPADGTLGSLFFIILAGVALLSGTIEGPHGFRLMDAAAKIAIFAALIAGGALAAWMTARSMRPGAGPLFAGMLIPATMLTFEGAFFLVFRNYDAARFVPAGLTCLGLGVLFAVPTAFLAWLVLRQGYVTAPVQTGLLTGLVGGLAGLGMLELHCPILTVPHTAVWHVAVLVVCVGAGGLVGRRWQRMI